MDSTLLDGLNPAQKAAVTSTAAALQVLAPPGSGKTKTLTSRVAYLLAHHGYKPQNVICCTFTIKASREMRERLRTLVGPELESKLNLGTFHSICRRYLVVYGHLIGVPKNFGIADTSDSNNIVKRIVKRLRLSMEPRTARSKISSHKAKGKTLEDLTKEKVKNVVQQEFVTVFTEYETALATSNLLDYDDLLLRCVDLLKAHPNCVRNIDALLIDEFQDTNVVQFELMKLLASSKKRITIVGDPDQSIYGFRSAEIENLHRMRLAYPDTVVINLEENYRSSSAILKLAQDVIEQDFDRPDKKLKATHGYGTLPVLRRLPNPNEEALWIANEVKRITAMTGGMIIHSDIAVLLRSGYLSLLIEKAFTSSGIPYRMVGGQRFFDRVEIRLVVDYLRTIAHPDNNPAFLAIINVPSRKIGETTIASMVKAGEDQGISLWSAVQRVLAGNLSLDRKLTKPAETDLRALVNLINTANGKMKTTNPAEIPSKLIEFVVSSLDLEGYLKKKYKDDHADRIENIKELAVHASDVGALHTSEQPLPVVDGVEQQTVEAGQEILAQFLANIVLSSEVENSDNASEKPRVTISTIHSAKGLEWPIVFVPAVYEGSIPHSRAEDINEERRLLYVAMTRAKALLSLTFPVMQSRDQGESALTQFLPESVHRCLAKCGPLFGDKVIEDIATILRREKPSQEALVKSLQTLSDGESTADDAWPEEGGHRPFASSWHNGLGGVSDRASSMLKSSAFGRPGHANLIEARNIGTPSYTPFPTTMNNTSAFSTANMSLGFTTASQKLKTEPVEIIDLTSDKETQSKKKKPSLPKTNSSQGNLTTFLSQSNPKPLSSTTTLQKQYPSYLGRGFPASQPVLQRVPQGYSLSRSASHPSLPSNVLLIQQPSIPQDLSTHRIGPATGIAGNKRPRSALEEGSPNKKPYGFLSSSPTRDQDNKMKTANPAAVYGGENRSVPYGSLPGKSPRKGGSNDRATAANRTLGVRRTMNGWNDRRKR